MTNFRIQLEPEKYYHIYNRGTNSCDIFIEPCNFEYFLRLYEKYIPTVADTYAWALMKNHFHMLVRILNIDADIDNPEKYIYQQFSNLFNAYSKAFNKRYNRTGSLFEHTFRRKLITNELNKKNVILYIHNNPVHHRICKHPIEYPWSSYLSYMSLKSTDLKQNHVLGCFDGKANFQTLRVLRPSRFVKVLDSLY